jgi:CheY-specific phosphatase CheX
MLSPTLTTMQLEDLIEQCAIESAVGLFLSYSVCLETADETESEIVSNIDLCGIVGFVGRQISGTLLLAATTEPLKTSNRVAARQRDWMAELSNQLFGRIKNRLLRRGLQLIGAPPAVIGGDHLVAFTGRNECQPIVLRSPSGGRVCVWMDYAVNNGLPFELSDLDAENASVPHEGDVLLF